MVSLGALTCVIGFIFDAWLEIQLVHTGMYIYSQVIPWGSVFTGTTFQFPLIWESFSVTFVMVPAAILCYRDDTGRSVAEKLSAKARLFPTRPVLGTFLVMFVIINISYFAYGGGSPSSRPPRRPPPSPAHGRIRKPKCMTRKASTRRRARADRTPSASGRPG